MPSTTAVMIAAGPGRIGSAIGGSVSAGSVAVPAPG